MDTPNIHRGETTSLNESFNEWYFCLFEWFAKNGKFVF